MGRKSGRYFCPFLLGGGWGNMLGIRGEYIFLRSLVLAVQAKITLILRKVGGGEV
jgi:hypothetical protein